MDPITVVGLVASIVQLIDATTKVVRYLNDVKDAPKDRSRLAREATSLLPLFTDLRYKVEEASSTDDPWFDGVRALGAEGGPLDQFKGDMDDLARKLKPETGAKKIGATLARALVWTIDKGEINNILSKIERLKTRIGLALQGDLFKLSLAIKDDLTGLREDQRGQESREITAWLSTLNFSTKQNDFLCRREEGTGEWLLKDDDFKSWVNGTGGVLWCPGLPGAGKTILASIVVNYLEQSFRKDDVAIAYVYCNYKDQENQTAANLIASLLQQVVHRSPIVSQEITSAYQSHIRMKTRPMLDEYSNLLQIEVRRFSKVLIIIDALDECPESSGTRASFLAEIRKLQPNVQILVTSRHSLTIERDFEKAARVEVRASDGDVRRYLKSRIGREGRLARIVKADPTLQEAIINAVAEKAEGMFLLAQLHMDSLARKLNRRDVRNALENLPKELTGTYDEAIRRIRGQDEEEVKVAQQLLCWISCAFRPLTVREIQHALAVKPGDLDFDEYAVSDEEVLVSVCAGLVTIDQETEIIRLVHYTAQEYFERVRTSQFPGGQAQIAMTCLTYMSFDAFANGHCDGDEELEIRLHDYPLLRYAVQHWGDHAREGPETIVKELALKFVEHNSKLRCSNQVSYFLKYPYGGISQIFPRNVTGLHVTASFGLQEIVRLLIGKGANTEARDSDGGTALSWAAQHGQEAVVQLLLAKGADIEAGDNHGRTALSWAARDGQEAVVRLLLTKGADIDVKDNHRRTALSWAARDGQEEVMQLLLAKGADIEAKDDNGGTALSWAARDGQEAAVQLLLEKGANIEAEDSNGRTPLIRAAWYGKGAVVQLLLAKGANINAKDSNGRTALVQAALTWQEKVVWLLLAKGADIEPKDSNGRTVLVQAARYGQEAVVRLLLEKGANTEAQSNGTTALVQAAKYGKEAVVQLLLEKAADIEAKDSNGMTALVQAVRYGQEAVVRLLLEKGANTEAQSNGMTALIQAATYGQEAVVRLLLEKGANTEAQSNGMTALVQATKYGKEAVVQLLLEKRADIKAKDNDGNTALFWAARGGNKAVVQLLLEKGADIEAKASNGMTVLAEAAFGRHEAVVQLLLKKGVDIEATDNDGKTALFWAARGKNEAVVQLLLEKGADIKAKDNGGKTALLWAAWGGNEAVVQLLLEKGADIKTKDNDGKTALFWAARGADEAVVQRLLEKGADIKAKGSNGMTVLAQAALYRHKAAVQLLLKKGANIEEKDNDGKTALFRAAQGGNEAVVQLLLEKGADVNTKDGNGMTVLAQAAHDGQEAVVQLLLEKGARIEGKDNDGNTALFWAEWGGSEEILQLLTPPTPNP